MNFKILLMRSREIRLVRRVYLATLFGLLAGFLCAWGVAQSINLSYWMKMSIIVNRTLMGFAIGISRWRMPWWFHGPLMGALFGLPVALYGLEKGVAVFWAFEVASVIYGFFIEFLTTIVFGARR